MKKLACLLLIVMFITIGISSASADRYIVTTCGDSLNMREFPQGRIVGSVPNGRVVEVVRTVRYDGCYWAVVEHRGCEVYLFQEYLRPACNPCVPCPPPCGFTPCRPPEKKSTIDNVNGIKKCTADEECLMKVVHAPGGLNVRKGPSTSEDILVRVNNGCYVELLEYDCDYEWAKIRYSQTRTGWVMTKYLEYAY